MSEWHDYVGIVGMTLIVGAYLLLQLEYVSSKHVFYSLVNAVGASMLVVSLVFSFNLGALIVEAFWALISVIGICKHFSSKWRKSGAEGSR